MIRLGFLEEARQLIEVCIRDVTMSGFLRNSMMWRISPSDGSQAIHFRMCTIDRVRTHEERISFGERQALSDEIVPCTGAGWEFVRNVFDHRDCKDWECRS